MNHENVSLTEAEWKVMECLWEKSPRTGRETTDYLKQQMDWSRSTTLTLLRRLEEKGAVVSTDDGRMKQFSPLISREDVAVQETENLLDRAFQGSVSLLVSSLTKKQKLSQKDIDELYSILDHMEEQNNG